jgi:hypothetical protein
VNTIAQAVWDYIAVYAPRTLWQDAPPKPVYSDNPVRDVINGAKESINRLLAAGTTPAGGGERRRTSWFIRNMGECSATKRRSIFRKRGLAFQERDLAQDPGALGDLKKLGNITTPVIVIDGAVIVGFDSAKIDGYT